MSNVDNRVSNLTAALYIIGVVVGRLNLIFLVPAVFVIFILAVLGLVDWGVFVVAAAISVVLWGIVAVQFTLFMKL